MATQLYVKSEYSLLSSMCRISETVLKCKELGFSSLAIVDKNVLISSKQLKDECLKNNIKPIYGMEIDLIIKDKSYPICLYAKNDNGYKNLMHLSSFVSCNEENIMTPEILIKNKEDLFVVFESDNSPVSDYVKTDELDSKIDEMISIFGQDVLIGICDNNVQFNRINNDELKKHLDTKGIKTIAISRTFYLSKEDAYEYEILKCIRDKKEIKGMEIESNRYFLSNDEFKKLYDEKDIANSDILAKNCNVELNFETSLPSFPTPGNVKSSDYLISLARKCLEVRLNNNVSKEYESRLNYELKVIIDMGFADYFLIVYDYIKYAKKNGYLVGPGRGSAAGALVSYALGITEIDPIKYNLLFERFLNPERVSMPDIDTDFPDDKRDDVINYVQEKYGNAHAAQILTFGTLKAKQALRDVARVMGIPSRTVDSISKTLPKLDAKLTLTDAYNNIPNFKRIINISEENRKLFRSALKIEGLPRHYGVHPAGVVFSKENLEDVIPLIKVEGDDICSVQFDAKYLEDMGLIKMDFLSLKNLTTVDEICDDVKKNIDPNFNIRKIPLNDPKTFASIANADLLGVFQFESKGMRSLAKQMKPKNFEELGIMIALFRPGPMENIPQFLSNRSNPSNIKYLSKDLEPILKDTYGIIVYQEQIMTIARKFAGFSYGKADILRRAMSKKKMDQLVGLQNEFIEGCVKNGYDKNLAITIYELILKFANYGFNKSHSIAYTKISYDLSYLKANYPLYFYKALLNETIGDSEKTSEYIKEFMLRDGKVKGININNSSDLYIIDRDSLVLPFSIINGVGVAACEKIIEERSKGKFNNYIDATVRLSINGVPKNVIENLISAGAFDSFEYNRYTMISSLEAVLAYANVHKNYNTLEGIGDDAPLIEQKGENKEVCANIEKKVLGFFFTYNPINDVKTKYNINTPSLKEILEKKGYADGFGHVTRLFVHKTKNGDDMEFIDIEDDDATCSLVLMPRVYEEYKDKIKEGDYILFNGNHEREESILAKKIKVLNND